MSSHCAATCFSTGCRPWTALLPIKLSSRCLPETDESYSEAERWSVELVYYVMYISHLGKCSTRLSCRLGEMNLNVANEDSTRAACMHQRYRASSCTCDIRPATRPVFDALGTHSQCNTVSVQSACECARPISVTRLAVQVSGMQHENARQLVASMLPELAQGVAISVFSCWQVGTRAV